MKTPARRIHTGDQNLDRAQQNAVDAVRRKNADIFDGGTLLTEESGQPKGSGLKFTSGTARVLAHGLGRNAVGFFEVYAADVASAANVALRSSAMPAGYSSKTHIALTPTNTGISYVFVF